MHIKGILTLMAFVIVKTVATSLLTGDNVHNSTKQDIAGVNGQNVDVFRLLNQETIIRMNLVQNVHALMKDMLNLNRNLAVAEQKISVLKTEVQQLKTENQVLKKEIRVQRRHLAETIDQNILMMFESMNSSLENFKATLLDTGNRFSAQISDIKNSHSGILSTVTDLKKIVAFTAGVTSSSTTWSSGTLVFPVVINNIGGGYNPSTGIFTAPTDGHYVLFVTVVEYRNQYSKVDIVLNGTSQVRTIGQSSASYQTGANLVVLRLQQGDTVWIRHNYGKGYFTNSVPITTFSGFLL